MCRRCSDPGLPRYGDGIGGLEGQNHPGVGRQRLEELHHLSENGRDLDGNPLLGLAHPWSAGAAAVLEACRNVACVGGEPAAVTDCLNFGNPEIPEAFWQFTEAVRGVGDACRGVGCYAVPGRKRLRPDR